MRTLRDTLLAAAAALVDVPQSDHIKVWVFKDAPLALQELSQAGGDEDWLAVVPNAMPVHHISFSWLDHSGACRVRTYPIAGARVFIGQHA